MPKRSRLPSLVALVAVLSAFLVALAAMRADMEATEHACLERMAEYRRAGPGVPDLAFSCYQGAQFQALPQSSIY